MKPSSIAPRILAIVAAILLFAAAPGGQCFAGLESTVVEIADDGGTVNAGMGQTESQGATATLTIRPESGSKFDVKESHITSADETPMLWSLQSPSDGDETAAQHVYRLTIGPNGVNSRIGVTIKGKLVPEGNGGGRGGNLPQFTTNAINVDLDADTDNTTLWPSVISHSTAEDQAEDQNPGLLLAVDGVLPVTLKVTRVQCSIAWQASGNVGLYADAACSNPVLPTSINPGQTVVVFAKGVTESTSVGGDSITAVCTPTSGNGSTVGVPRTTSSPGVAWPSCWRHDLSIPPTT